MTPARRVLAVSAVALMLPAAAAGRSVHAGAAPAGAAPAAARLQLVLPLVTNVRGLTRLAESVSTPGSPQYGDYRSVGWLAHHFGASAAARGRVVSYLRAHGAVDVSVDATGQLVRARMARVRAERLFASGRGAHASAAARLPRALRGLVTGVVGFDAAPLAMPQAPLPSSGYRGPDPDASPAGCAAGTGEGGFTPNEYLDAYQYAPLQQQGLRGQGERVALVEIDGFKPSDLAAFARCFGLHVPRVRQIPVGMSAPPAPGGEATLDLEVLDAAAPDLNAVDVYETSAGAADVLRALSAPLQSPAFKPQVISVSLGLCESQTLESVGSAGIRAIETVLKVASAAGVSVLGASGDFGSADCQSGKPGPPSPLAALAVNFPSSSPWVTSVGGVNFDLNAQNQILSQTVWNDAGALPGNAAGGGVSQVFSRPSWQDGLIKSPWRAQPDVAMLADISPGYAVYCTATQNCQGRGWLSFGGTSAATPLLAGGFALVDELLRRQGHVALGSANPLLYRLGRNPNTAAQVFYDVTSGSNDVGPFIQSNQQPLGCCSALPGYDEASGWGGVNLQAFGQAALAAGRPLATVTLTIPAGQHPVASGGIYVQLSCTAGCETAAYARVSAPGMAGFSDYAVAHLVHRNTRRLEVAFTPGQLVKLRAALRAGHRVTAQLMGAIVDAGGNIERRTPPVSVTIVS